MFPRLTQHDFRAFAQRKSGNARADGGKGNRLQPVLRGDAKGVRRRAPERARGRLPAELHARRVNHMAGFQLAAGCDRGSANGDGADFVALSLDPRAAFAPYRSSHATAELQIVVRGVHDGVRRHFREIALADFDSLAEVHSERNPVIGMEDSALRVGDGIAVKSFAMPSWSNPTTTRPPATITGRRIRFGS